MKRLLTVFSAIAVIGLLIVPGAFAQPGGQYQYGSGDTMKTFCASGTVVLNVTETVAGDTDYGAFGQPWASDTYTRRIVVVRTGGQSYCAATADWGTFTAVPGATSPGGGSTLILPVSGLMAGGDRFTFTGKFDPSGLSACGFIGAAAPGSDWKSLYFRDVSNVNVLWWAFAYYTPANGIWANKMNGNYGDIVG